MLSRTLPIALDGTLPACWTIRSQVSSQNALKHTAEYALKYTPNCTRWHTPSLLDCTLPSMLSRRSQANSRARSQVHSPEARHSQSDFTICSHVCSWVLGPETCWVAGARYLEAGGGRRVAGGGRRVAAAEIMTSVDIIVWTLFLARPPRRDLTMPHGHGVDNCRLTFCRKGRQLDLGESRSMIPPVRTDPVWGRAQSGPVPPESRTGPGPRLAVLDWMGLVWTSPNRIICINFKVDPKN